MIQTDLSRSLRILSGRFRRLPDFIIVGTQRGGTTSLYNYLIQHPHIAPAMRKEVHFFDVNFQRGLTWYRSHFCFDSPSNHFVTGEGTPYYLFHPLVACRIAGTVPNAKLIVLLRNPIDRAYSHYHHEVRRGREELSFEEAIGREADRLAGETERLTMNPAYRSTEHQRHSYMSRGIYADQLAAWMQYFGPHQLHVVQSEQFFATPQEVLGEVQKFLQLPVVDLNTQETYQKGHYDGMNSRTREWLRDYFRAHNVRLYGMLQRDFKWDS